MPAVRAPSSARLPIALKATGAAPRAPVARAAADGFDAPRAAAAALTRGMTGAAVRALQQRLQSRGFLTSREVASGPGVFGPRTEAGLRNFQRARGLPVTGTATRETLAALTGDGFVRREAAASRAMARTITDDDEPTAPLGRRLEGHQAA